MTKATGTPSNRSVMKARATTTTISVAPRLEGGPAPEGAPQMRQAIENDERAPHGHGRVDVSLGQPHHRRLLELAELHQLPALLDEDPAEAHHGQDAEDGRQAPEPGREAVDHEMEAEVGGALHAHRRPQEHDPHEEEPRDLVVPRERAAHHVARENAQEHVRAEQHHHDEEDALDGIVERATNHRAATMLFAGGSD